MKRRNGFTLIEVMIVMVILALLVAIAYPGFSGHVVKARRIEAQAALLETMQKQESYFTQHNTYIAFSADSTGAEEKRFKWWSGHRPERSGHEPRGPACPGTTIDTCIELQAVPGTERVDAAYRDAECRTLTLSSTGEHKASGEARDCWP